MLEMHEAPPIVTSILDQYKFSTRGFAIRTINLETFTAEIVRPITFDSIRVIVIEVHSHGEKNFRTKRPTEISAEKSPGKPKN